MTVRVTVSLPDPVHRHLQAEAAANGVSLSDAIRQLALASYREARPAIEKAERSAARVTKSTEPKPPGIREQRRIDKERAKIIASLDHYRSPEGYREFNPDTGRDTTWAEWIHKFQDVSNYKDDYEHDQVILDILERRRAVYTEAAITLGIDALATTPDLPSSVYRFRVPRCDHLIPLDEPCYDCECDEQEEQMSSSFVTS